MANNNMNKDYDLNAGVIGFGQDHQRAAGEGAIEINVDQQNFTQAHPAGDSETMRESNDHANAIRDQFGVGHVITTAPEDIANGVAPPSGYNAERYANMSREALYAMTKYGEYVGATNPYEAGKDPELDAKLAEMQTTYDTAYESKDIEAMAAAAGSMNEAKMAAGFMPISYAKDMTLRCMPEGATQEQIDTAIYWQTAKEVDGIQASVGRIGNFKEYVPGTDPAMDASLKMWGDTFMMGRDSGQIDMMRVANDEANKVRVANGYLPGISYGSFGYRAMETDNVLNMAQVFAQAQDEMEAGVFNDNVLRPAPFDHPEMKAALDAERSKQPTAVTYESIMRDANNLTMNIPGAGPQAGTDLDFAQP